MSKSPPLFGLTGKKEKILNDISPNGKLTNAAVINKNGNEFSGGGKQNFLDENSPSVDGDTMFAEGSVGKIRFAGLAWMLQQEGVIDLQKNAGEFFRDEEFGKFLKKKYPDQAGELRNTIVGFFAGNQNDQTSSASATLADLFTHRAGIGDLTRAGVRAVEKQGVEHEFTLPELILDGIKNNPDLIDEQGKPRAHRPIDMPIPDNELPESKHGNHEYSNLNYMIGALAMEFAYSQKYPEKELKDYKQLTRDFMLDPLGLKSTKFPEEILEEDNVFVAHRLEHDENGKEKIVNANRCSSANAAGGMFASANDSTKFFEEFFRGFPGTEENGKEVENKFFKPETIQAMKAEWTKYPPANGNPQKDGFFRFQGPGFTVDYPLNEKNKNIDLNDPQQKEDFFAEEKPICYCKGGGTVGYNSWFEFNPKTGDALISVDAQENFTGEIAKKLAAERGDGFVGENEKETNEQRQKNTSDFIKENSDSSGYFDREKMIQENMPQLLNQTNQRPANEEETKKEGDPKTTESKGETPSGGKWVKLVTEQRNAEKNKNNEELVSRF
jgi:CubicO group peptidase (beta-lactamase class C family)